MEGTGMDGDLVVNGELVLQNRSYHFKSIEISQGNIRCNFFI